SARSMIAQSALSSSSPARGLTAQHGRANCCPCRDARPTIECTLLRTMSDRSSAGFLTPVTRAQSQSMISGPDYRVAQTKINQTRRDIDHQQHPNLEVNI